MPVRVLINGQAADLLPVSDRGLQYGDGLFETLAIVDGAPRFWQRHMARLERGEKVLGLTPSEPDLLRDEAGRLCSGCDRGVLKLIITRGSGGRGYRPPESPEPRRILSLHPWPDYPDAWYREGIRVRQCETHWSRNRQLAGIKHLNRLQQVLARQEWRDPQIAEGLMCDDQGGVISATQGNLFLVGADGLSTPDLSFAGIRGIMRDIVIETAGSLGISVKIEPISLEQLAAAQALFVTNSLLGLCPVAEFEGRSYSPAAIPSELRNKLNETLERGG